jgi:hypothetical protein
MHLRRGLDLLPCEARCCASRIARNHCKGMKGVRVGEAGVLKRCKHLQATGEAPLLSRASMLATSPSLCSEGGYGGSSMKNCNNLVERERQRGANIRLLEGRGGGRTLKPCAAACSRKLGDCSFDDM